MQQESEKLVLLLQSLSHQKRSEIEKILHIYPIPHSADDAYSLHGIAD